MIINTQCSICLLEYTISGDHKMASLKCGHCFGEKCIKKWISLNNPAWCPVCFVPCRKCHVRIIYDSKELSDDNKSDVDLIVKYYEEVEKRKILEIKMADLEKELEIMKYALKNDNKKKTSNSSLIYSQLFIVSQISFVPENSLIEHDPMNGFALITFSKAREFGFYKYTSTEISFCEKVKLSNKINDIKISPFMNGYALIASGANIIIINLYNNAEIFNKKYPAKITAICFDNNLQDVIYGGDIRGWIFISKIYSGEHNTYKVSECSINSLSICNGMLYASSVLMVYKISMMQLIPLITPVSLKCIGICTDITSDNENVLCTFRSNTDFKITQVFLGTKELMFFPGITQKYKHPAKIFNEHIYIVDDIKNVVIAISIKTLKRAHIYQFQDEIINMAISTTFLLILTKKNLYWYTNELPL